MRIHLAFFSETLSFLGVTGGTHVLAAARLSVVSFRGRCRTLFLYTRDGAPLAKLLMEAAARFGAAGTAQVGRVQLSVQKAHYSPFPSAFILSGS